jgi:hypothetical protein
MGLEDPFLTLLMWFWRGALFPTSWSAAHLAFPRVSDPRESVNRKPRYLLLPSCKVDVPSLLLYSIDDINQTRYNVWGGLHKSVDIRKWGTLDCLAGWLPRFLSAFLIIPHVTYKKTTLLWTEWFTSLSQIHVLKLYPKWWDLEVEPSVSN